MKSGGPILPCDPVKISLIFFLGGLNAHLSKNRRIKVLSVPQTKHILHNRLPLPKTPRARIDIATLSLVAGPTENGTSGYADMGFLVAEGVSCVHAGIAVFALARLNVFFTNLGFALLGSFTTIIIWTILS